MRESREYAEGFSKGRRLGHRLVLSHPSNMSYDGVISAYRRLAKLSFQDVAVFVHPDPIHVFIYPVTEYHVWF